MLSDLNLADNSKNTPNPIIMIPPTWLKLSTNPDAEFASTLLITTPIVAKTTENPNTKNIVFKITLVLLMEIILLPDFWLSSATVVPEMYARKAGIIGKMHGATNEPNPASCSYC